MEILKGLRELIKNASKKLKILAFREVGAPLSEEKEMKNRLLKD
jgi:hypothetical protein